MTVGQLEDMLRKFDRSTEVHTTCGACAKGSSGGEVLRVSDQTDQTFGYIILVLNEPWKDAKGD